MYQQKYSQIRDQLSQVNIYEHHNGVKRLREIGEFIYKNHLDMIPPEVLLRLGGELAGLYASFGNAHATARAEHEISENTYKQVYSNLQLAYLDGDTKYKVSEAKSLASKDLESELGDVIIKESIYKQWENVMETTKMMVMFIQSVLSTKRAERFTSSDLYNATNQQ